MDGSFSILQSKPIRVCCFVESREEAKRRGYRSRSKFLEEHVFTDATLTGLKTAGMGISLAAFAEEEGISSVIEQLNSHGIPTDLWLNLPYEHGYWQSKANVSAARTEVAQLLNWISPDHL